MNGNWGLLKVLPKPGPGSDGKHRLEELRKEAARAHPLVERLIAEAELQYAEKPRGFNYVSGYHRDLKNFVESISEFLEGITYLEAEMGLVGKFSLAEAIRRRDWFADLVARLQAQETATNNGGGGSGNKAA